MQTSTVLHVPYTFFPDPCGGTEVYVRGLARRLAARGYPSAVAAPAADTSEYMNDGLAVYRFATDQRRRLEIAYSVPDEIAAQNFRAVLRKTRPRVVHLHARTSAISERLIEAAHDARAAVVFTYHTPTVSCARGTMMLFGQRPCDGIIEPRRCTTCFLTALGAPKSLARLAAVAPGTLAVVGKLAGDREWLSFLRKLRIPSLLAGGRRGFDEFMGKVDHVIAVCQWVKEVLERNGVAPERITLCRQGISQAVSPSGAVSNRCGPLRIAYFGRIDWAKGADLLARALEMIATTPVQIDIFGVRQSTGPNQVYDLLAARAWQDPRMALRSSVEPDKVIGVMAKYDLVAIPSRSLETGPLVALEAFAAGVPVLGADLGGIAELVRNGVGGFLVPPNDVASWAAAIVRFAENRHLVREMRDGIPIPRNMEAVADDMTAIYSAAIAATTTSNL
jgi:glycosyltransferase involved in cell wall biosynthesis